MVPPSENQLYSLGSIFHDPKHTKTNVTGIDQSKITTTKIKDTMNICLISLYKFSKFII